MSTETSCHFSHLLLVSKESLWSPILYKFFHDFMHVYSPGAGTDIPQGTKFWCQQKCLVTSFICCKVKKKCLWSLILYIVFPWFNLHVYSPGAGAAPRGQNFDVNRKALSHYPFVASFKEISSKSDFIQFFMISNMYIAPGQGAYSPLGTKFWCQQKLLVTSVIRCKFQITDDNSFCKIHCFTFFPIQNHKGLKLTLP